MVRIATVWMIVALLGSPLPGQQRRPAFDVASVRKAGSQRDAEPTPATRTGPDRFYRAGDTLSVLIRIAYEVQAFQVVGGPDWVRTERFEINAKAAGEPSPAERLLMLQTLLQDRFKLVLRREPREMRHLALVPARGDGRLGPYLGRCENLSRMPAQRPVPDPRFGTLISRTCASLSDLVGLGTARMGAPVIDKTGLAGLWNYQLIAARTGTPTSADRQPAGPADGEIPMPFDVAVQDQLGLKLEAGRGPVEVLVIDSVSQPTEN